VQELIAADPAILGLGDLDLRQKERPQPRAGPLDLLLQDRDTQRRYEVEIQLGPTDEAHIIRTIEYWDIERKRYPQYDHCAVIVAEDITSRFLNVLALFNGANPFIALQMQALKVGEGVTLVFTKVVDELSRGLVVEDEDAEAAPADRAYWEMKGSKQTMQLADQLLSMARKFEPSVEPKYNKFSIGLSKDGQPFNFVVLRPRKNTINVEVKLPRDADLDRTAEEAGLTSLNYLARWGVYTLSLSADDVSSKTQVLKQLMELAHRNRAQLQDAFLVGTCEGPSIAGVQAGES
jgi:hypothetical protein